MKGIFGKLGAAGFVHVTGLVRVDHGSGLGITFRQDEPIFSLVKYWGTWDSNNGVVAVVTTEGHVWIRVWTDSMNSGEMQHLLREVCPKGAGCGVPC